MWGEEGAGILFPLVEINALEYGRVMETEAFPGYVDVLGCVRSLVGSCGNLGVLVELPHSAAILPTSWDFTSPAPAGGEGIMPHLSPRLQPMVVGR